MSSILDGLGLEGSVLDGLAEWPVSTTRKEWFAITRQLIQQTIAEMAMTLLVIVIPFLYRCHLISKSCPSAPSRSYCSCDRLMMIH